MHAFPHMLQDYFTCTLARTHTHTHAQACTHTHTHMRKRKRNMYAFPHMLQNYFSMEALMDVMRQVADLSSVPEGLEQPQYRILRCMRLKVLVTGASNRG